MLEPDDIEKIYYYTKVKTNSYDDLKWIKEILSDLALENVVDYEEYQKLLRSLAN